MSPLLSTHRSLRLDGPAQPLIEYRSLAVMLMPHSEWLPPATSTMSLFPASVMYRFPFGSRTAVGSDRWLPIALAPLLSVPQLPPATVYRSPSVMGSGPYFVMVSVVMW